MLTRSPGLRSTDCSCSASSQSRSSRLKTLCSASSCERAGGECRKRRPGAACLLGWHGWLGLGLGLAPSWGGVSSPPRGRLALLAPDGAPRSRVALRRSEPSERPQHGHPTGTQGLGRGCTRLTVSAPVVHPGGRLLAEGSAPLLPPNIADESLQILSCAPLWDKE